LSRPAKSGTFVRMSGEAPATAQLYTAALVRASAGRFQEG
jgi:hypothetical protein